MSYWYWLLKQITKLLVLRGKARRRRKQETKRERIQSSGEEAGTQTNRPESRGAQAKTTRISGGPAADRRWPGRSPPAQIWNTRKSRGAKRKETTAFLFRGNTGGARPLNSGPRLPAIPPIPPRSHLPASESSHPPIPALHSRAGDRAAASHGNGAARERRVGRRGRGGRRRRRRALGGVVRSAAVRRGLGVRAQGVQRLLPGVPGAAGGGRRGVARLPRPPRGAPHRRRGGRLRRLRHLRELRRRARRRALDPRACRPHPAPPRRRQAHPRRLLRPPDPVPRAGRADRAVDQGVGHRRELHPPDGGGGEAVRAAEAAGAHAGDRVPPGRGVGAAPQRGGAGAVRQDPRRDVPPRRPRHGRPGPPRVQQGHPHEHRRPPPPARPHPGLPGGRGEGELRRAAAGQGAVEEGVQGLPQGEAPVAAAPAEAAGGGAIACCCYTSSWEGEGAKLKGGEIGSIGMPRLIHPYFVLQSSEFVQELPLIRSINKREKKWLVGFLSIPGPSSFSDCQLWCLPRYRGFFHLFVADPN